MSSVAPKKKSVGEELPLVALVSLMGQVGLAVVVSALLCAYGGHMLDVRLGTAPWGLVVGGVIGFVIAMLLVWRITKPVRDMLDR